MRHIVHVCLALCVTACAIEGDDQEEFVPRGAEHHGNKCVHTLGWWKTHNRFATQPGLYNPWPISESSLGCGKTWLEWLMTPPEGDAATILGHQWIVARLNWAEGAAMPAAVADALYAGAAYLNECGVDDEDREDATAIAEVLDAYNNGLMGVASCD